MILRELVVAVAFVVFVALACVVGVMVFSILQEVAK